MPSMLDWQQDIYGRLREALPGTKVYLEGIPENSTADRDPTGLVKPFLILWFGQLTTLGDRNEDLCGPSITANARSAGFLIQMVAPSGLALLQMENMVRGLLTGFSPADQGPLMEGGSTNVRDPFPVGIGDTLRFYKPLFFSGTVTLGGVDPTPVIAALPQNRTHCPQGHPYDEANTIINADGKRRCRTCVNSRAKARRAAV